MTLSTLLLIIAFVLFAIAAFGVNSGRFSFIAAGLACWVLSSLAPTIS